MQFPLRTLEAIRDGRIDLAFRRWDRARALPGTRRRTAVGVLAVGAVDVVDRDSLTEDDARRAGYDSLAALLAMLDRKDHGEVHRIELSYAGADPRIELRQHDDLSDAELNEIATRLKRFDEASTHGPWTKATLELIAAKPEVRAEELAHEMGREKLPFKRDVRKLKELGLTESRNPGYKLSPRGNKVLQQLAP